MRVKCPVCGEYISCIQAEEEGYLPCIKEYDMDYDKETKIVIYSEVNEDLQDYECNEVGYVYTPVDVRLLIKS